MTITLNAAPTPWASDTNYASGPAIGTATKVDPGVGRFAQGWVPADTLPAQHLNFHLAALGASLTDIVSKVSGKAVDGVNGGTYTLASNLRFNGVDVQFGADVQLLSGSDLEVLTGARIVVSDGAEVSMGDSEDLTIDDSTDIFRVALGAAIVQYTGGAPTWLPETRGRGWRQSDVAAGFEVCFPVPLPTGDSIVNVSVAIEGGAGAGHSSVPTTTDRLRVSLVKTNASGVSTVVASKFDPSASVGVYDALHTVVLASGSLDSGALPELLDDDFTYFVVVEGETGANAIASTTIVRSVFGDVIARSYRSSLQTYS